MKHFRTVLLIVSLLAAGGLAAYEPPVFPYDGGAGEEGSVAIAYDSKDIVAWASSVYDIEYGEEVADEWKVPSRGLGPASSDTSGVVVLGRGGRIILSFDVPIRDGPGFDFAVFENGISDTFLELAYVEVSSDGIHFVRFPNYSLTALPVGGFGNLQPEQVHGYAGKHRVGFGTPFDLSVLSSAYDAAVLGNGGFSGGFRDQLIDGYPFLDPDEVRYVRLIDIPGDGSMLDCEGFEIFDPYPTVITSGFDLDAVGVLNHGTTQVQSFSDWSAERGLGNNPIADTDEDKWPQYLEYLMGSHPGDRSSVPALEIRIGGNPANLVMVLEFRVSDRAESLPGIQILADTGEWIGWEGSPALQSTGADEEGTHRIMEAQFPIEDEGRPPLVRLVAP